METKLVYWFDFLNITLFYTILIIDDIFRPNHLKRHVTLVHEGVKDHKCEMCGKAFSMKVNMERHISQVHEGKKDHTCEYCGLAFATKAQVQSHRRNVHEDRPKNEICHHCGKAFKEFERN